MNSDGSGASRTSIGIIGGLGPLAGAHVYECVVHLTPATSDQEHPEVVLLSRPFPSRIAHLTGGVDSPLPDLVDAARSLSSMGCTVVGLASATTHAYRLAIQEETGIVIADGLRTVADAVVDRGAAAAVVLCTSVSRMAQLYDKAWLDGVDLSYPSAADQDLVDKLIDNVKRDDIRPADVAALRDLIHRYVADGVICVLGCTELPILWTPREPAQSVVSVSDAIAGAVLSAAGCAARRG